MTDRPLVLVTGATGAQGGSVARHLLRSGRWAVRAVTRDPRSAAAAALTALGADVVACDLTDPLRCTGRWPESMPRSWSRTTGP